MVTVTESPACDPTELRLAALEGQVADLAAQLLLVEQREYELALRLAWLWEQFAPGAGLITEAVHRARPARRSHLHLVGSAS